MTTSAETMLSLEAQRSESSTAGDILVGDMSDNVHCSISQTVCPGAIVGGDHVELWDPTSLEQDIVLDVPPDVAASTVSHSSVVHEPIDKKDLWDSTLLEEVKALQEGIE